MSDDYDNSVEPLVRPAATIRATGPSSEQLVIEIPERTIERPFADDTIRVLAGS